MLVVGSHRNTLPERCCTWLLSPPSLVGLVDGPGAKISGERPRRLAEFCCWCFQAEIVVDFEFGAVGTPLHLSVAPAGIEDEDALRIGAEILSLSSIQGGDIGRDDRPSSDKLVLEGLLLADGAARQESGATIEGRLGFQRLVAEVGLGNVGLVLGVEMSRLARSCRDWHQLLEICALFDTLIADADGVYDPAIYNDRLLLGLKRTVT
jgi:hypothetical protein